jgi:hypothetical protein
MRSYFAQMAPALRQIGGLAGDLGMALGRLSAGTGLHLVGPGAAGCRSRRWSAG